MKRYDWTRDWMDETPGGTWVQYSHAQAEIDTRDKRIAELEAEARELRRVVFEAKHGKRPA